MDCMLVWQQHHFLKVKHLCVEEAKNNVLIIIIIIQNFVRNCIYWKSLVISAF